MKPVQYVTYCVLILGLLLNGTATADTGEIANEHVVTQEAEVAFGYQSFSLRNEAGRAGEYRSFSSSPTFGLKYFRDKEGKHFRVEANYLNDEDFHAEVNYSKGSLLRVDLRTERFFHNLDHVPYDNGYIGDGDGRTADHAPATESRPDGIFQGDIRTYYTDHNPADDYGVRININEAKVRAKLPSYPAHVNLAFWQIEKTGKRQLRFVDENCTGCHMQSRSRTIDRVTNEFKGSVDGHFGYVDLEAIALYREFKDNESIPTNDFDRHARGPLEDRAAGTYDHSEDPDATVKEFTLRANTSPSGGLVGSASMTFGKRENKSDLHSIQPVEAETDYFKSTADVTYTPHEKWTINLRHRYLDIDNDNSDLLLAPNTGSLNPNDLEVRDSIDFTRAWYEIIGNYRPSPRLTVKAELRREDIKRDQTGPPAEHHSQTVIGPATAPIEIDPYWQLPDEESITKFKLGFHSRHLEKSALKVSGWASLEHSDDPSYGTSFSDSYELFLSTRYTPSAFWGVSASLDLLDESNDDRTVLQFDSNPAQEFARYDLDRNRTQQNLSLGGWWIPSERLSLDVSYGYLATQVEQDLLFGAEPNSANAALDYTIENDNVDYDQTVQTLAAGATLKVHESLDCRLEAYHIRSKANFDPDFATTTGFANGATATSSELKGISEIDLRQNGVKGRVNWQIDDNWSCNVTATYDDYEDKNSNVYDGSVISYMASISRVW